MTQYKAPIRHMGFTLDHIINYGEIAALPAFQDAGRDVAQAVLEEAGRFMSEVIDPLRRVGDIEGSVLENGVVKTPTGFKEAYAQYVEAGWNSLSADPDYGGQGLPFVLAAAMMEMLTSANMAFALCPMLGQGAVEALVAHGDDNIKTRYIPKLISGEWSGTMNLTEPQAGSDLGALRTRATPRGDGTYLIEGQKIFITWGDHEMAENIIHLVLARLPDAPEGTKGISLFLVPKYLLNEDGTPGQRNDLRAVSLEHKLGIHASPTCVMSFGDNGNCIGYLVGEENKGMRFMFTMMNHARVNVGIQGIAQAELAFQQAFEYAGQRIQGVAIGKESAGRSPIIEHADVRRMLFQIRAMTEAARAIAFLNAKAIDIAAHSGDKEERWWQQGLADLLTPLTKAYGSDVGFEAASLAVQVHGGMGYIEETGVAQTLRDARIAMIYEGTNGIQAMDLVGRKLGMDGGEHWKALFTRIDGFVAGLPETGELGVLRAKIGEAMVSLRFATDWLMEQRNGNMRAVAAAATPYLRLFASTVGAWLLAVGAANAERLLKEGAEDAAFLKGRIAIARFYAEQLLPPAAALMEPVTRGDALLYAQDPELLVG
ncbi:MAG TPA: acyl-CoA dehydrogenase [Sphingomonadales bacterium]